MTVAVRGSPAPEVLPAGAVKPRPTLGYLGPLDGVRALAVLGVFVYHGGVSALPGGFLGVDTFFVLSGFLITSLLVKEWSSTTAIRLRAFWGRRARRLLPALFLVLFFVAAYAALVARAGSYPGLRGDALSTLFYVANWHFIFGGANYFVANGPISPLTHTWSLAVEEQFYFVWPLVVFGMLRLCRRLRVDGLAALLLLSAVGALASAALMALLYTGSNDTRLYYGTDTHAQSVLTGATLALALLLAGTARQRRADGGAQTRAASFWTASTRQAWLVCTVVGVAGLVGTIILWTRVDGNEWWLFHGGFLLAAVTTAALLLGAVAAARSVVARLLDLAPLRYVGRISYGLYLWHFPLFILLNHARTGLDGWALLIFRSVVTGLVATASFYAIEKPIREGSLFRAKRGFALATLGIPLVALVLVAATAQTPGTAQLAVAPAQQRSASGASQPSHPPATPTAPPTAGQSPGLATVLLVGDSMDQTLGNGVAGQVGAWFGLNIVNGATPNCSLATGTFQVMANPPRESAPPCQPGSGDPGWPTDWTKMVGHYHPQVSVFLGRLDLVNRYFDGRWTHIGEPAYDAYLLGQLRLAVRTLSAQGGKVVLLTSPYYDTGEQPGGAPWPEDDPARVNLFNDMLRRVATDFPAQAFVINLNAIADPSGTYAEYIDGVEVRFADGIHWTYQGDCWLAPRLLPLVARIATTGRPASSVDASKLVSHAKAQFPTTLCRSTN